MILARLLALALAIALACLLAYACLWLTGALSWTMWAHCPSELPIALYGAAMGSFGHTVICPYVHELDCDRCNGPTSHSWAI